MAAERLITTTGAAVEYLPPDGPERDELLGLIRIGLGFRAQQVGKRPGALARLVLDCCRKAGPPYTFAQLLEELDLLIDHHVIVGSQEKLSPVEKVSRSMEVIKFHDPRRGLIEVPFTTLRGHLTAAKKILKAEILPTP